MIMSILKFSNEFKNQAIITLATIAAATVFKLAQEAIVNKVKSAVDNTEVKGFKTKK
jgi:hypothetical protein